HGPDAARHSQAPRLEQADLYTHVGVRPFRARTRPGRRLLVGEDRPRRTIAIGGGLARSRPLVPSGTSQGDRPRWQSALKTGPSPTEAARTCASSSNSTPKPGTPCACWRVTA